MAVTVSVSLEGVGALQRRIDALGGPAAKRIMRRALRAGSKEVLTEVRRLTPVKTGNLRRAWVRKFSRSRARTIWVAVRNTAPHRHIIMGGTEDRVLLGRGKYPAGTKRGRVIANRIARIAAFQTRRRVSGAIIRRARKAIVDEWRKRSG